jgi:hypothetical protein
LRNRTLKIIGTDRLDEVLLRAGAQSLPYVTRVGCGRVEQDIAIAVRTIPDTPATSPPKTKSRPCTPFSRNIARPHDISSLSRYVATPPDAGSKAAAPPEKFYPFFLKDLAEASSRKHQSRQGNCVLLTDQLYLH